MFFSKKWLRNYQKFHYSNIYDLRWFIIEPHLFSRGMHSSYKKNVSVFTSKKDTKLMGLLKNMAATPTGWILVSLLLLLLSSVEGEDSIRTVPVTLGGDRNSADITGVVSSNVTWRLALELKQGTINNVNSKYNNGNNNNVNNNNYYE